MSSAESMDDIIVKKNKLIFIEGGPCKYVYLVKEGRVLVVKEGGKKRLVPLALYSQKDFLGLDALYSDHHHSNSAIAIEDVSLVRFLIKDLLNLISSSPIWVHHLMKILSERFRSSGQILAEQNLANVSENIWNDQEEIRIRRLIKEKS